MADTKRPNSDSSKKTVIDLEGSELHHDLKNQKGEKGDPDHTDGKGSKQPKEADKD